MRSRNRNDVWQWVKKCVESAKTSAQKTTALKLIWNFRITYITNEFDSNDPLDWESQWLIHTLR